MVLKRGNTDWKLKESALVGMQRRDQGRDPVLRRPPPLSWGGSGNVGWVAKDPAFRGGK